MLKNVLVGCLGISGVVASAMVTVAQSVPSNIAPDNTLGNERSIVQQSGQEELIRGGAQRGRNLFHSFQEFNVGEGRGTYFLNPSNTIQNILTRVTGNNPSEILGAIGTRNAPGVTSQPNFFLINPQGIIFGVNADLNVGGSFVATTANAVKFSELGLFSASQPTVPGELLRIDPSALLYNSLTPQSSKITVRTQNPVGGGLFAGLQVTPGKSLLLIGGDVYLEDALAGAFSGGRVEIGGLSTSGEIELNQENSLFRLKFPSNAIRSDIALTGSAIFADGNGGGSIAIHANNLSVSANSSMTAGISNLIEGSIDRQAGSITIDARDVVVTDGGTIRNIVNSEASGNAGDITIKANQVEVTNGGQINSSTLGRGNAGNIIINAENVILGDITSTERLSFISSSVDSNAEGQGGNITINAEELQVRNQFRIATASYGIGHAGELTINTEQFQVTGGALVFSSSFNQGNAGDITIQANTVNVSGISAKGDRSGIFSTVEENAEGNGGNLLVEAQQVSIQNGGIITSDTSGKGNAGNLTFRVRDLLEVVGQEDTLSLITANVNEKAEGRGGNLTIDARRLSARNYALISASTAGKGNAGDLIIRASDDVEVLGTPERRLNSEIQSEVRRGGTGNAGNLLIETNRLSVRGGAVITTTTLGNGNAGNLTVRAADSVELDGDIPLLLPIVPGEQSGNPGGLLAQVDPAGKGRAGDLTVETRQLSISNGSKIQAATFGEGNAGSVIIQADEVDLFNTLNTGAFFSTAINAGATQDPRFSQPRGSGGSLTIETGRLSLHNPDGASNRVEIAVNTDGIGNAGKLTIRARDSVEVVGQRSSIAANVNAGAIGEGGGIKLETPRLSIRDQGKLAANSAGEGIAGNLEVDAQIIELKNRAGITAETLMGQGGSVRLNAKDYLLLRQNSQISATAGTAQQGGDGGNIEIFTKFVIAAPGENSDIFANAYTGKGGRVQINAQGIFGIQPRSQPTVETNDITVSSQFGVSGTVILNIPDIDPSRGLTELPSVPTDPSNQISQSCSPKVQATSSFIRTGRGGIPANPSEPLDEENAIVNWVTLNPQDERSPKAEALTQLPRPIIEAQSWRKDANGNIVLVAEASPNAVPAIQPIPQCPH
jgi:filamentous hemagglutinin family protein